ncbi:hypothetical protein I7I48_05199 [Histoplasma ohiense]|nr:hypothetical protein I7I48_05199 [Histoplasma ohiense (nom. inval.)]
MKSARSTLHLENAIPDGGNCRIKIFRIPTLEDPAGGTGCFWRSQVKGQSHPPYLRLLISRAKHSCTNVIKQRPFHPSNVMNSPRSR